MLGGSAFAEVFTPSSYAALNAGAKKRHSLQHGVKMSQRFQFYWGQVRDDDASDVASDDEKFWLEHDYLDNLFFFKNYK